MAVAIAWHGIICCYARSSSLAPACRHQREAAPNGRTNCQ